MVEFEAFRVHQEGKQVSGRLERLGLEALSPGEVVIKAAYSSVNYKDALAATGKGKIIRRFPCVAGIDVAGHVFRSDDPRFKEGDAVLVTGYDLGVAHDGGYSGYVRAPAEWVVALPRKMSLFEAMALGTAGFTAAMCVQRLEENNQRPDSGPFVVTGATGGVGQIAVNMMSALGYEVVAVTGKAESHAKLQALGAAKILDRNAIDLSGPPLERGQWGGAIDNVGGDLLAWLTRTLNPFGNIASVGLAGGHQLQTTVMPFILRGVSLLGITSAGCPTHLRQPLWERLADDLAPAKLGEIVTGTVGLDGLETVFEEMLAGRTTGRTVVEICPPG